MAKRDRLMGVADVATELGLTDADVRQWARSDGDIARIGTTWVFTDADLGRLADDLDECFQDNPGDDDDDDDQDDDDQDDDDQDDDDQDDDDQDDDE
ncbi:MAG: hypothetical protein IT377_22660 [Polyangiaceae bacterium]|nr:hypothetical protein [Polyangiaceae bacterium]